MPKISVLLPVYNEKPEFLDESIQSIVKQTMPNFELLLLDDGSDKECADRLDEWTKKDGRIKVLHLPHQGITKILNKGINAAQGKYIARMDGDDVAFPNRFQQQVDFLEQNPDHATVGSWVLFINESGDGNWIKKYPTEHGDIKKKLIAHNRFTHSSLMFRADKLRMLKYNENLKTAQDYDLLLRAAWHCKVANIPGVLLKYRYRQSSVSWKKSGKQQERDALRIRWNAIRNYNYPWWHIVFLARPLAMYGVPKWMKFGVWKNLRWEQYKQPVAAGFSLRRTPPEQPLNQPRRLKPAATLYATMSLTKKLSLLLKSNLTAKQKTKGMFYIILKQNQKEPPAYRDTFSKKAIAEFADSLRLDYKPFGQFKFAPSKVVPSRFASCFTYKILDHLGELGRYTPEQRREWAEYIQNCQDENDGLWYEMERNSKTHDQEYIALQLTTFALDLLKKEGLKPKHQIKWLDRISFPTWLYQRDFSDPWKEGNRILFVGQLLLHVIASRAERSAAIPEPRNTEIASSALPPRNDKTRMLPQLMNWLDKTVDPKTGFWGTNTLTPTLSPRRGPWPHGVKPRCGHAALRGVKPRCGHVKWRGHHMALRHAALRGALRPQGRGGKADLYTAMLGAYHQYVLYKLVGRRPPYIHSAVTNTLGLQYPDGLFRRYGGGGACEDIDAAEILIQGHSFVDEKTQKRIQNVLATIHKKLIKLQHTDGGFAYNPYLALCYSGIPLLQCQKGESDIFSTWFRLKTIERIKNNA